MLLQKSVSEDKPTYHGASSLFLNKDFVRYDSSPSKLGLATGNSCDNSTQVHHRKSNKQINSVNQHTSDESHGSGSTDNESDNNICAYECCCSEKCNVIDIASGKCSTLKSTSSHFPHLDAKYLNDSERAMLCGHLQLQFREISRKYARLVSSVKKSLKTQGVTAMELTEKLMDLKGYIPLEKKDGHTQPLLQDRFPDMNKATTTDQVFRILSDYSSFFNHDIIEFVVDEVGTDDDMENLKKYQDDFMEYCKRSVFECPFSVCSKRLPNFVDLVMKVDSPSMIAPYSMQAVQLFQAQVARLLHITKHTLKLCSVEEGCLKLSFQIPRFLSTIIFPLNTDQRQGLTDLGIISLDCDGVGSQPLALEEPVNVKILFLYI